MSKSDPLAFLKGAPQPVDPADQSPPSRGDRLPQAVANRLMQLDGVGAVWVERDPSGRRVVVIYTTRPGPLSHLPTEVDGMPVRQVGGGPIKAY